MIVTASVFLSCRGAVSASGLAATASVPEQETDMSTTVMDTAGDESAAPMGLLAENEKLRKQLQQAQQASKQWQHLHSELHSACVSKLTRTSS